jgi:LytR cell envelope-related transcriptional attenuator
MSRPGGFQNDEVARGAGVQLAKGAGLVLIAIIIGIVLLQVVDDGSDGPVSASQGNTTTTTTEPRNDSTTPTTTGTTTASTPAKSPEQLRVIVLNAGAATGAAGDLSDELRSKGYTNQAQAGDWPDVNGRGRSVFCKAGSEQEAAALAVAAGNAKTGEFPDPPPPGAEDVDCIVAIGA